MFEYLITKSGELSFQGYSKIPEIVKVNTIIILWFWRAILYTVTLCFIHSSSELLPNRATRFDGCWHLLLLISCNSVLNLSVNRTILRPFGN